MNEMLVQENLDNLVNVINQIKHSSTDNEGLIQINSYIADLRAGLNSVFSVFSEGGYICTDVLFTNNTDKEYFGVVVNPSIDGITAFKIFATGDPVVLTKYQLELDSKLFITELSAEEIASIIIFEISSMLNPGQIAHVRSLIDIHVLSDDDVLHLRDSVNYNQLIIYAIKDTLYKVSSLLFKESIDDALADISIQTYELQDALVSAQEKLVNNVYGMMDSVRTSKTVILQWVFMIYQDVKGYAASAIDTLRDAKSFTASKLLNIEIDKTIDAIDKAGNFIVREDASLNKFFDQKAMYSLNELGLFKSLKLNGLRSIEDDYYELAVQVKAIETESDALYILRSINSRLSILEDYIYNNDLKENEKKHWLAVAKQYRDLRNMILNKKINKRKYSDLFMDYDDFPSDND